MAEDMEFWGRILEGAGYLFTFIAAVAVIYGLHGLAKGIMAIMGNSGGKRERVEPVLSESAPKSAPKDASGSNVRSPAPERAANPIPLEQKAVLAAAVAWRRAVAAGGGGRELKRLSDETDRMLRISAAKKKGRSQPRGKTVSKNPTGE